jgi:hypothetical protein
MIDQLTGEKNDAVKYLERQRVGRITRTMKRVWERGCRVEVVAPAEKGRGKKSHGNATAAAAQAGNGGIGNDSSDQGDFSDCAGCFEMD